MGHIHVSDDSAAPCDDPEDQMVVEIFYQKSHYTILPLDSKAQIPGFWNPMVKWCNGIFSDQNLTK
jgi:hypothetical protein